MCLGALQQVMLSETSRQNYKPRNLQGIYDCERRPLTQIQSAPCNHRRPQRNINDEKARLTKYRKRNRSMYESTKPRCRVTTDKSSLKGAKSTVNFQLERKHRLAATTKQQASLGSNLKLVPKLAVCYRRSRLRSRS